MIRSPSIRVLLGIAITMITIHIINMILGGQLSNYGVIPREFSRLWGIFTAPWVHNDIPHLLGNLSAFLVLSWLCMLRSIRYFIIASAFIIVVGGVLVWLFGRSASHAGASGWIFGLWALLIANAYFERTIKNSIIGIVIFILYGGLLWGLLPSSRVSFEGHIAGMAAGVLFAWLTTKSKTLRELTFKSER